MTTPTTVQVRLQIRADTAANWTSINPILLANELGLETDTKKFKIGDGTTTWNSLAYFPSIVSGGTVLGNLEIGTTGTLTFEGSTADGFETTLGVVDPTADRTILLPNQSGTVVVGGNASITDADIAANAEIAVSKLANGTANQVIVTDGTNVSWSDDLTLAGNLTVNGTTTTVNTETLVVEDKNIELGVVGTPTDLTADGGGITLKGTTDKTINWIDATDAWTSSERFSVPLGSAAAPSLTFTGDENSGIYSPGADQLALSTSGVQRINIEADGDINIDSGGVFYDATNNRLGIWTSSPAYALDVNGVVRSTGTNAIFTLSDRSTGTGDRYGIYSNASTFRVYDYTAATDRVVVDSSGRVGIGDNGPDSTLTVKAATGVTPLRISGPSSEFAQVTSDGKLLVGTSSARANFFNSVVSPQFQIEGANDSGRQAAIISSSSTGSFGAVQILAHQKSGSVGGTTLVANGDSLGLTSFQGSEGAEFVEAARIEAFVDGTPGANDMPGRLVFSTTADGASSPTERMRITQAGILLFGNISSAPSASVFGAAIGKDGDGGYMQFSRNNTGSTTHITFANPNGVVGSITTNGSATAYNTSSDYRLKENVTPVTDGITRLQQLKPSRFNFIADPGKTVDGFIAHEVQTIVPEAITGEKDAVNENGDPKYQGIDQSKLVPLLTAALQEAVAKIETLEAKVAALESA